MSLRLQAPGYVGVGRRARGVTLSLLLAVGLAAPALVLLTPSLAFAKLGADEAPGVASGEIDAVEKEIPTVALAAS